MSSVTNLTELNINYLTQAQYDTALANDEINENEIYFTPSTNSDIIDLIYPVGSIYMSVNSASPATLFGGTWTQLKDMFLLGAGDTYSIGNATASSPTKDGGAATVSLAETNLPSHTHTYTAPPSATGSHTLTVNEIPAHYHAMRYSPGSTSGAGYDWSGSKYSWTSATESSAGMKGAGGGGGHSHTISGTSSTTGAKGSGTAFSNMPPYLTVYMWKRTA